MLTQTTLGITMWLWFNYSESQTCHDVSAERRRDSRKPYLSTERRRRCLDQARLCILRFSTNSTT